MGSLTLEPAARLSGSIAVPGDKAISHRALILAPAIHGAVGISGLSPAGDVASTRRAMRDLGLLGGREHSQVELEALAEPFKPSIDLDLEAARPGWASRAPNRPLDCGNSGSTMRMLMGALAGPGAPTTLSGDASLSRRPMERVAAPLRQMGARISLGEGGKPPVLIEGAMLAGIDYVMPVASAQVKTAILLAGLQAQGATTVRENAPTRDHTERMLAFLGCETRRDGRLEVGPTELLGDKEINIPGDFSSASFLLSAAALLPGSEIEVRGVGVNPTRTAFLDILRAFGAEVSTAGEREVSGEPRADLRVRAADRRPVRVDPAVVPGAIDELPLVAVLGCAAEGDTEVRGASELRVKESDRIATIAEGLTLMGADLETLPDGFVVHGPCRLRGATVDAQGDHRIAMALSVAALGAEGPTTILGWEAADVSYPGFAEALGSLVVR